MKEPKGWHSRGYLPHLDSPQLVQTVTFRLADSLPRAVALELRDRGDDIARWETVLDAGHGACWLSDPAVAHLVEGALLRFDGARYRLIAWCVMPNHVHVMAEIDEGYRLGDIVASWKQFSARMANRHLARTGPFWQADYFDRYVRDDAHFAVALQYIEDNPVQAGLVDKAEAWRWSSAWRRREG
jgi:putative transposase